MSAKKSAERALSLVGQGYIYGAKGQICSLKFREGQAAQYPEYYENIMITGAKWDGIPVWDCAQFTREVAKAAGISFVSGATSQWNKTDWDEKGTIDTIPAGEFVFLYRRQNGSSTVMQHTGVAVGDGTCIHAKGTAYGVVRQNMNEYAWTHWARPKWPDIESEDEKEIGEMEVLYTAEVFANSGSTVNLRKNPNGSILARVPVGTTVNVYAENAETDGWSYIQYGNITGYMQSSFLKMNNTGGNSSFEAEVLGKLDEILSILKS